VTALSRFVLRRPGQRAFVAMVDLRQEYLPQWWYSAQAELGTDVVVDSSAKGARNEMIFEHLAPSCYLREPFPDSLEQSASASRASDVPAEDMHRAVLRIYRVYAEICETKERIVASSPRKLDHEEADGMSAGG
jgi:hypothetical protein